MAQCQRYKPALPIVLVPTSPTWAVKPAPALPRANEATSNTSSSHTGARPGCSWPDPVIGVNWPHPRHLCRPVHLFPGVRRPSNKAPLNIGHKQESDSSLAPKGSCYSRNTEAQTPDSDIDTRQRQLEAELRWALEAINSRKQQLMEATTAPPSLQSDLFTPHCQLHSPPIRLGHTMLAAVEARADTSQRGALAEDTRIPLPDET
eukprot:CAMPEP_0117658084 /NCGR_PEP_ID=MMETSP0804-20121206/5674_1 /TAXON_ID=1074897 /ORGANISM="Tetraselmis astigmatica, Strain CCMP880" /LENGTH=204 /DNA_ID=CAMNT_0005464579 /DNA_START=155 /DNA_END=771 /DNA_ORIENTATION=+